MEEKHQSTVIRDVIAIVILGIIALIVQFPTPHRTTVIEGDITLSYPVGNTVPYDSILLFDEERCLGSYCSMPCHSSFCSSSTLPGKRK